MRQRVKGLVAILTAALERGNGLVKAANGTTPSPCNLHAKSVDSPRSPMYTRTVGVQHAGGELMYEAGYLTKTGKHAEVLVKADGAETKE